MITSFEVAAIFSIEDAASESLATIAGMMEKIDQLAKSAQAALAEVGRSSFSSAISGLDDLATAFGNVGRNATGMSESVRSAGEDAAAAALSATAQINEMAAAYDRATEAARNFAGAGRFSGFGGGFGGGGPIIDGEYSAAPALGYEAGEGALVAQARGFGRGNYGDPRSGPAIPMGGRQGVPGIPPWPGGYGPYYPGPPGGGGSGAPKPGFHMGIAEMGIDYSVFETIKSAAEEDNAARSALEAMNIKPTDPGYDAKLEGLRASVHQAAEGTIFSGAKSAMALPGVAGVLSNEGDIGYDQLKKLYPTALRLGELSEMRHKGDMGHEAVAAIELAHQLDQYDPSGMAKDMDEVNAIAKRTDSSIDRQKTIFKYGLPSAMAAGIDPQEAMATIAFAEQRMGASSTAGTGYAQFLAATLKTGGGLGAHLEHASRDAEKGLKEALNLEKTPGEYAHHQQEMKGSAHTEALRELGITDAHGKLLDVTASGGLDQRRVKEQIYEFANDPKNKHTDVFEVLHNAFGTIGGRWAMAYTSKDALQREGITGASIAHADSVKQEQDNLSKGPMQTFERAMADTENVFNALGHATLPGVTAAFNSLDTAMKSVTAFLNDHPHAAEAAGYGGIGVAGLATFGLLKWGVGKVGSLFGLGGQAAGAGVELGEAAVAGGAAAGGSGLAGLAATIGVGIAAGLTLVGGSKWVDKKVPWLGDVDRGLDKVLNFVNPFGGEDAKAATPTAASAAGANRGAGFTEIKINIGPISLAGVGNDIQPMVEKLFHEMGDKLGQALTHSSSAGLGSISSPFSVGLSP